MDNFAQVVYNLFCLFKVLKLNKKCEYVFNKKSQVINSFSSCY